MFDDAIDEATREEVSAFQANGYEYNYEYNRLGFSDQ